MEELRDITTGLEQRITIYKATLKELQRKHEEGEDEIQTVRKYLELAETLYRVELDKSKLDSLTGDSQDSAQTGEETRRRSKELLLGRTRYAGLSVPQAVFLLFRAQGRAMHAKEILQHLLDGGVRVRGKTPLTSIAISLKRDTRFRKTAPNTFALAEPADSDERG